MYEWEDQAFLAHMRCKQKYLLQNKKWFQSFGYKLIDYVGEYGVNPGKIAIAMLKVWLLFSILFTVVRYIAKKNINISIIWEGILDSIYAFVGIGLSPIEYQEPSIIVYGLIAFECLLGYFLLAYFFSALIRKTLK